jgi:hypothetical protein
MDLRVIRQVGTARLECTIAERDEKTALLKAVFFLEPDECGHCHKTRIVWTGRRASKGGQSFAFIARRCRDCGRESTMGEYQAGGFYWKAWIVPPPRSRDEELDHEGPPPRSRDEELDHGGPPPPPPDRDPGSVIRGRR